MKILDNVKRVYFIGIGGIGMSALAQILSELGYKVFGSDLKKTPLIERLQRKGIQVTIGHSNKCPEHIDLVVYTSCINSDNPEMITFKSRGVKLISRGELLAELFNQRLGIAIAGTHGKTTTTALIAHVLKICDLDPSVAVGAEVPSLLGNAVLGQSDLFVAEADESDGSFLKLKPSYGIITNIEEEHLDYYKDIQSILKAYTEYSLNIKPGGYLVACHDDDNLTGILKTYKKPVITYGFQKPCNYRATNLRIRGFSLEFDCLEDERLLGTFALSIPGRHNVLNALAAIVICKLLGIEVDKIAKALKQYKGSSRRFEVKSNSEGIILIEDYAHHPTEIKATIEAARHLNPRRIIVAFQPHRYSRTKHLKEAFSQAFNEADYVIVTDIYSASEKPIEGIDSQTLYNAVKEKKNDVCFLPIKDIVAHIMHIASEGDLIIIMGAGDIGDVSNELASRLKKQNYKK
jgi:UDP-N-acetylmuramate--alanine ligase